MKHRSNQKHHAVRRSFPRSGDFDAIRESWLRQSLPALSKKSAPQRRTNRMRGNVSVQKRATFYVASIATRDGVVRGIDNQFHSAVARARLLANSILEYGRTQ